MSSALTWLDTSREDQRRMRELLNMFTETESRDELGVGQVRDAFSDILFPGTSTLHTRARYLLFVPWCYQEAEARGRTGARLLKRGSDNERKLIEALRANPDLDGVIGRRAGAAVKTLPSTIYSGALQRYGVQLHDRLDAPRSAGRDDVSELTERAAGTWRSDIPLAPALFPSIVEGEFDLTTDEAAWLRDRIRAGAAGSFLEHLVDSVPTTAPGGFPWDDPAVASAIIEIQADVQLAANFSTVIQGASLLYNLLVAEAYKEANLTRVEPPVELYQELLTEWSEEVSNLPSDTSWSAIRDRVIRENPRISSNLRMQSFVAQWFVAVQASGGAKAATDSAMRDLVRERELSLKKAQSRFRNSKLLATWNGQSGSSPLSYRWRQAKVLVDDILSGLEGEHHAAA